MRPALDLPKQKLELECVVEIRTLSMLQKSISFSRNLNSVFAPKKLHQSHPLHNESHVFLSGFLTGAGLGKRTGAIDAMAVRPLDSSPALPKRASDIVGAICCFRLLEPLYESPCAVKAQLLEDLKIGAIG